MRRKFLKTISGAILGIGLVPFAAHSQTFPSKPMRIIVPGSAGGPADTLGRLLGKLISENAGVPVIIENRPGAAGTIGVTATIQAPPDGHTLMLTTPDAVTIYPLVKKSAPYDSARDLLPITLVAHTNMVYVVNPQSPVKSMKEFVALTKSGAKVSFASSGSGGTSHIVLEMLQQRGGFQMLHVPYKGAAPALQSVAAGETHITASSPVSVRSLVEGGKLKALAVTRATRTSALPEVPTMEESGFNDFVVNIWFGIFTPAQVPPAIADKLNELVLAAVRSPEFTQRATGFGLDVEPVGRQAFASALAAETTRWKQIVDAANISVDE